MLPKKPRRKRDRVPERYIKSPRNFPPNAFHGSNEAVKSMKKVVRMRQVLEAVVYETEQEEYDWQELNKRWWPERGFGFEGVSEREFYQPWKEFDRSRRPNVD